MANAIVSTTIPFPSGGWNARDSLDGMAPNDAVRLQNLYCTGTRCQVRGGTADYSTGMGTDVCESLAELTLTSGVTKLVAFANSKIYNVTTATAADITNATLTPSNDRWQTVQLTGTLLMFNGVDQPQQWNGAAATTSDATYTGSYADEGFVQGCIYKNRLYVVTAEAGNETYLVYPTTVKAKTGACSGFDCGYYLTKGGGLQWVNSFSRGQGQVAQDFLVVAGKQGDLLIYAGDYPGNTWELVNRFFVGRTLGRRSYVHIPGDLLILTEFGVVSVAALMNGEALEDCNYFAKISEAYRDSARSYSSNFPWEGFYYPALDMVGVNVPLLSGNATTAPIGDQYVINRSTGAPARFTDIHAACWLVSNNVLYFGGTGGKVYKADTGFADNGSNISIEYESAFSDLGDRRTIKHFDAVRPLFAADEDCTFNVAVDVDYVEGLASGSAVTTGSGGTAWSSPWGSAWSPTKSLQNKWVGVSGIGYAGAVHIWGALNDVDFELATIQIRYHAGGEI